VSLSAGQLVGVGRALWRAGIVRPAPPKRIARSLAMLHHWGPSPAVAYALGALRHPDRAAIIDDCGALSFEEVHRRTNALARAFQSSGIGEDDTVAIMCRNHRGFIESTVAAFKLGARPVFLPAALDPRELAATLRREDAVAVVYDEEFTGVLCDGAGGRKRFLAWCEEPDSARPHLLEELIAGADGRDLPPPIERPLTVTIVLGGDRSRRPTSRRAPSSLLAPSPLLASLPLRTGETTIMAAPLCHPWGFAHMKLGMRLASTLVLHREFDPERVLRDVALHDATALVTLPRTLERIVQLPREALACHGTSSLRVIAVNGATLQGELAMPAMAAFGPVLFNLRGESVVRLDSYWSTQCGRSTDVPAWFAERGASRERRLFPRDVGRS